MPVFLHLANLIFDKRLLEQKYLGGCAQFTIDWNVSASDVHQEDDELISLASMNMDEFQIDKLIERGLEFNSEESFSMDFVAISRYRGPYWETEWLKSNGTFAWHVHCQKYQSDQAKHISEVMTMDEIQKLSDKGINVFGTIKTEYSI